jgi:hypothetical protein
MGTITVAIPFSEHPGFPATLRSFIQSPLVEKVYVVHNGGFKGPQPKCSDILSETFAHGKVLNQLLSETVTDHLLLVTHSQSLELVPGALERFVTVASETGAGIVYSDFFEVRTGQTEKHPLTDYQPGSVRDGFDFGGMMLLSCNPVRYAITKYGQPPEIRWGALYDLRLKVSVDASIFHIQECLYTTSKVDTRASGDRMFDYVDPRNEAVQKEMEQVFTQHLKNIGAYLVPQFEPIPTYAGKFPVEASIVIPVRNRAQTIRDALTSALQQEAQFPFNVIVVENHSTDGTREVIESVAKTDGRVTCIVPERDDLGIGGCWNEAVNSAQCGRYAVQLDSDDLYSSPRTLQTIVDAFRTGEYAMVIGSYKLVNAKLENLPPGTIDHREWTPDNGRNNALRVNGLGAPRAFCTHLVRENQFPNVSYGEDYAVGLALSRKYRIGRIYDPLYLCRRWEGNTDAALTTEQSNKNDTYKDRIRTIEILARQKMNRKED